MSLYFTAPCQARAHLQAGEEKRQICANAHDHQSARQQAFDEYWVHQQEARAKDSTGVVQRTKTW
jgi:hypothetical protein